MENRPDSTLDDVGEVARSKGVARLRTTAAALLVLVLVAAVLGVTCGPRRRAAACPSGAERGAPPELGQRGGDGVEVGGVGHHSKIHAS